MIRSRLYYNIKEQDGGILKFYYYTAQIDDNSNDLKTFVSTIDHEEVIYTAENVGFMSLLFDINKVEFEKFVDELNNHKEYIENLAKLNPEAANYEFARLWGPNELQRKFQQWFEANGFEMPMKN